MRIYFGDSLVLLIVASLLIVICITQTGCQQVMTYNEVYLLDEKRLGDEISKAEIGNKLAARKVYLYYNIGLYDKYPEKTFHWLHKAASLGDVPSQYNLGLFYENQGNIIECAKWYHRASDAGNQVARRRLLLLEEKSKGSGINS